jgi:hypothetical protein
MRSAAYPIPRFENKHVMTRFDKFRSARQSGYTSANNDLRDERWHPN